MRPRGLVVCRLGEVTRVLDVVVQGIPNCLSPLLRILLRHFGVLRWFWEICPFWRFGVVSEHGVMRRHLGGGVHGGVVAEHHGLDVLFPVHGIVVVLRDALPDVRFHTFIKDFSLPIGLRVIR